MFKTSADRSYTIERVGGKEDTVTEHKRLDAEVKPIVSVSPSP